jgi:hypothetical protein
MLNFLAIIALCVLILIVYVGSITKHICLENKTTRKDIYITFLLWSTIGWLAGVIIYL